jgi:ankyrin repeat protein
MFAVKHSYYIDFPSLYEEARGNPWSRGGRVRDLDFYSIPYNVPGTAARLIEQGADIEARDQSGRTALMYAAGFANNPETVLLLLDKGADIEATDNEGRTPLILAALKSPSPVFVSQLLQYGADAHVTDNHGKKAIDYAKENVNLKNTEAYRILHKKSFE